MPSGKVHSALTLATVSGFIAPWAVVNLGGSEYLYILGCAVGTLVTPDLDVDRGNISDTFIRKVFPPAQWLWRLLWTPYALLVPHRHVISHFPILGTMIRIGYVFLVLNIINFLIHILIGLFDSVSLLLIWNWSFVAGLCHVDMIHFLADQNIKD